jgi:hypothetical protein
VLQKNMIWADVNPLSCYGTNDGTTAEAAMVIRLGLPKLREMVHGFVSGLIEENQLAEDAVVVVLGTAPWSCCEKLGGLLKKLDVQLQASRVSCLSKAISSRRCGLKMVKL